jgi:hypothetical protein
MISRAMVATKPGSPGRARRKPLKPIACGNAGSIRWTCGDLLVCFCFSHTRLRVHGTPGIPHALRGGTVDDKTRAHATRSRSRVAKSWLFENGFGASTSCSLPPCGGGPGRGVAASALLVWNVHREGTTTRVGPSPQPSPTKGGGSAPPLWRQQHSNRSRKTKLFRYLRAKRCRWLASKPCASVSSNRLKKDRREQGGMT